MATASNIEAFSWWLKQDNSRRTAKDIAREFNIPLHRATAWLIEFNKRLKANASRSVTLQLKAYVADYEAVQAESIEAARNLGEWYSKQAKKIAENPEAFKPSEVERIASGLKSVYQLVETASGADLAKKQAVANMGANGGSGSLGLPDLSSVLEYRKGAIDTESEGVPNDSPNENRVSSGESEEK